VSQFDDFRQDLKAVIHGNNTMDGVYITLRMRLRCEIFRNGKAIPGKVFDVLNEVVVDRGSNPYLSKIECYEHNRLITKVSFFIDHLLGSFGNANFHILRISTVTISSHICY
jgi:NAD kinase